MVGALGTTAFLTQAGRRRRSRRTGPSVTQRGAGLTFYEKAGSITSFEFDGTKIDMDESQVLGVGAQGKVHCGRIAATGEEVAVKAMPVKHLILDEAGAAKMALIDKEIEVLKSLGRHPNIAGCVAGGSIYRPGTSDYPHAKILVMELVKGKELAEHIAINGALSEQLSQHVFTEILKGLDYMHRRGVLHRDLKVQNILVSGDSITMGSEVRLIDFGVAKNTGGKTFQTLVGTLEILPPEMAKAKITYLPNKDERKLHTAKFKPPSEENPGFGLLQRTPEGFGARVINVDPQGAAGRQGVANDWVMTKINNIDVEEMLFQANPDDSSHAKMPKIVTTLMGLTSDFTLELMEMPPRAFSAKVDMWAVGVVLYTCLTGKTPFKKELDIIEADYDTVPLFKCSTEAKSILQGLLEKDPNKRLSLSEAMAHPWVRCAANNGCTTAY